MHINEFINKDSIMSFKSLRSIFLILKKEKLMQLLINKNIKQELIISTKCNTPHI
jgi:hypothetical protein